MWKDQQSQPRDQVEKANIAAEAMGSKTKGRKPRAPKFHRMSIAAAANGGITIDHTAKVKVKHGATAGAHFHGSSLPMSGEDTEKNTGPHVFGADHPIMAHVNAINEHIMGSEDSDGDSD